MFSAPLEVNFHVKLIWKTFDQHMLTKISVRAPKNVKISKNGPLAGCSTENSWNRTSENIVNTDVIHIDVLLLLKRNLTRNNYCNYLVNKINVDQSIYISLHVTKKIKIWKNYLFKMESIDYLNMISEWLTKNSNVVGDHLSFTKYLKQLQ